MSTGAIVSLLWPKHFGALELFARAHPGIVVYTLAQFNVGNLAERLRAAGAELVLLEDLLAGPDIAEINALPAQKLTALHQALDGEAWTRICAERGWEAARIADLVAKRVASDLPLVASLLRAVARAHANHGLRLLVVTEDLMPVARALVLWGKAQGIPSLHLSHGLILNQAYTVHNRVFADRLAVFSERGAECYLDAGLAPELLTVTGNPGWDVYAQLPARRAAIRAELARQYGCAPDATWILFGTTWAANLTAFSDEANYGATLRSVLESFQRLSADGRRLQLIVKDRPQNQTFGRQRLLELGRELGLAASAICYTFDQTENWLVAADVVISVDSNISLEAMLAETPAINLLTAAGAALAPSFAANCGIVEVEAQELDAAVTRLLDDADYRSALLTAMRAEGVRCNAGPPGTAGRRVAELMTSMALAAATQTRYPWQTLLDVEHSDVSQYHDWAQTHLFELFKHPPRRLLDIGCGAGGTGEAAKRAYPQATVFGIEVNRAAAAVAATRLDHVAAGKFEDIDLEALGIGPGSLDTVIVADVLEHIYDPWQVMLRLRPYLSADAQVIASIPNVRNLVLMAELAKGNWRYEPWGLLDVTHIRFFTPREARRFFHETGYRVTETRFNLDKRLVDFFNRHSDKEVCDIEFDRLVLKNVRRDELGEMCSLQVHMRAEPGALADTDLDAASTAAGSGDYAVWCAARQLQPFETDLWEARLAQWPKHPRVHLAIALRSGSADEQRLSRSLQSASGQLYHHIALSIVADVPAPGTWMDSDNLRWVCTGDDIVAGLNSALRDVPADWLGVIDAGDVLLPYTLLFMLEAAYSHPAWQLLYSDEDSISDGDSASGERRRPHFKPDFNIDLLRSYPYVGGLLLTSSACFEELGGFDGTLSGIEDYDLVLRAYERLGQAGIGHVDEVLLQRCADGGHVQRPLAELWRASQTAVTAHLGRLGVTARVEAGMLPLSQRLIYEHIATPMVSVIVVARNGVERLQRCLEALLGNNRYSAVELLVLDAHSPEPAMRDYIAGLEALGAGVIKAFRLEQDATRAAFHNLLAQQAQGDYLLFLDSDATPLSADWLEVLMAQAMRPEVGAVGPRLLTGAGKLRRAGLILGIDGFARSAFSDIGIDDPGYFGRALVDQSVSAIGAGAVLTRRQSFAALGGFDATLGRDAAEVDYCLRLAEQGLSVVWTPHASLLSEGDEDAASWGGAGGEALEARHLHRLGNDPNYSRQLSLLGGAMYAVDARTTLNWDPLPWKPLPRVLAVPADNMGCGQYRIFGPLRALTGAGKLQGWADFNVFTPAEVEHLELDAIVFQRQILDPQIAAVDRHRQSSKVLRVFELDDLLMQLPGRSVHHKDVPKDVAERLQRVVPLCDRFVVSTEPLAAAYRGLNADIRVVPNRLEKSYWGNLQSLRRQSLRPRVGWVGGVGHSGDLEMLADVVCELAAEVDWIFMGMCPEMLRPYVREVIAGVPFVQYPKAMARLNLDLAIAPLEINAFNEAKSSLRILEYGALGFPVICSDIYPYQGDFPVTRVRNRSTDWVRAIREHVADLDECARRGDILRQHVADHWMLDDHLDLWLQAWT